MAGLSGCVGERTEGKRGTVTFSTKHCLSVLHTAEERENVFISLQITSIQSKITPVVSATTVFTQVLSLLSSHFIWKLKARHEE